MKNLWRYALLILLVIILASVVGCGNNPNQADATAPAVPTNTPAPEINVSEADVAHGQQLWQEKQCMACHGDQAQGGIGGQLAKTSLPFDQFLHVVRTAIPPKPAYTPEELSDQDTYDIYGWLQSIGSENAAPPPATPELPEGEILGMKLWTEYECASCHGAFAQGGTSTITGDAAPELAGISYPYEMERAKMRQLADEIPQHQAEHIRDVVLQRLYKWLQAGANPQDGC